MGTLSATFSATFSATLSGTGSLAGLGLLAAVVALAAFVQGATGFGFALLVAPVIGLVHATLLPVALLLLMVPLNFYVGWRERASLDWHGAGWITAGRLAGTAAGFAVLVAVPAARLNVLVGASTVVAVAASLAVPAFRPNRPALMSAGLLTGVTETATGVGGPPMALVYQHRPVEVLRSTLALCFLIGELVSLLVLAAAGRVHVDQLLAAAALLPALVLGAALSGLVHHRLEGPAVRIGVLVFALASGAGLLVKALFG